MLNKFISNVELIKLLEKATFDEKLALSKIFDATKKTPYEAIDLQEKISTEGGHGVANWFRGQGTGYLDILDDIANSLEIENIPSYDEDVTYYDEIYYIKNEKDDTPDSKVKRLYDKREATELGLEYASNIEEKIILELIKKSYELMVKQKDDAENKLLELEENKNNESLKIKHNSAKEKEIKSKVIYKTDIEEKERLERQILRIQSKVKLGIKKENKLIKDIKDTKIMIKNISKRIEDFDNKINEVVNQFNTNNLGKLTGTAGLMVLANLGGFATYTFLTSMMSVVSFGTLGFGAYTAATSLLSIIIGPVGWAGLGIFAIFSLGKPKMSKLMPIVAIIGAIRQRIEYRNIVPRKIPEIKKVNNQTNIVSTVVQGVKEDVTPTSTDINSTFLHSIMTVEQVELFASMTKAQREELRSDLVKHWGAETVRVLGELFAEETEDTKDQVIEAIRSVETKRIKN